MKGDTIMTNFLFWMFLIVLAIALMVYISMQIGGVGEGNSLSGFLGG